MTQSPKEPTEIYGEKTAAEHSEVIIVGDDVAEYYEAYDTRNDWEFGYIGDGSVFETRSPEFESFTDFLATQPNRMVLRKMLNNRLHSDRFSAALRLQTGA